MTDAEHVSRRRPGWGGGGPPTIFDVAALAGVSNVIRGVDAVADPTRQRVLQAIDRLGYRPNAIARQFAHQRTTILGVLVGDLDNPFYGEMGKRLERMAFARGYTAMFCNIEGEDAMAVRGVEAMLEQRVAGVLFLASSGRGPQVADSLAPQVPVVFVGLREEWGDSVAIADRRAGRMVTQHLLDLGHRSVAYLTTPVVEERTSRARHAGYREALAAAGLEAGPPLRWERGRDTVLVRGRESLLTAELRGATAVVCANDMAAIALLETLDRLGVRVPGDVSLVGFDDVYAAGLSRISLTSVAQPLDELARIGVELLLDRVSGRETGPPRHERLQSRLVPRRSSAPPR